jgi:hypothetical protein
MSDYTKGLMCDTWDGPFLKFHQQALQCISNTNLDSKIERGDEEEATETYVLVRRGNDDEDNKVI